MFLNGNSGKLEFGEELLVEGKPFTQGDVIGCLVRQIRTANFFFKLCLFTLNGESVGTPVNLEGRISPILALDSPGAELQTNFGSHPFTYDTGKPSHIGLL